MKTFCSEKGAGVPIGGPLSELQPWMRQASATCARMLPPRQACVRLPCAACVGPRAGRTGNVCCMPRQAAPEPAQHSMAQRNATAAFAQHSMAQHNTTAAAAQRSMDQRNTTAAIELAAPAVCGQVKSHADALLPRRQAFLRAGNAVVPGTLSQSVGHPENGRRQRERPSGDTQPHSAHTQPAALLRQPAAVQPPHGRRFESSAVDMSD